MQIAATKHRDVEYSISDLAEIYKVSLRTLRFYEEKQLLRPRRDGQRRIFTAKDRTRLELIILAKRLGFSLGAIFELIDTSCHNEIVQPKASVEALGLGRDQLQRQLEALTRERDRLQRSIEELREAVTKHDAPCDVGGKAERRQPIDDARRDAVPD